MSHKQKAESSEQQVNNSEQSINSYEQQAISEKFYLVVWYIFFQKITRLQ